MVNEGNPLITEKEKEILDMITKEKLTHKQIREKKGCSRQSVYKIVKRLREKKLLPEYYVPVNNPMLSFDPKEEEVEYANHCYFCDEIKKLEGHHIVRKKDGGYNDSDNILLICKECHRKLHKNFFLSFSKGYFFMINKEDFLEKYWPNARQGIRDFPKRSLNNAILKGGLKINK